MPLLRQTPVGCSNFFVFLRTEICQVAENTLDRSQTVTKRILKTCLKTRFVKPLQTKFKLSNRKKRELKTFRSARYKLSHRKT